MGPGRKQLQLLAVMGDQVIDTDCQIPDPLFRSRTDSKAGLSEYMGSTLSSPNIDCHNRLDH
jgi:hypothetical protein